MVEREEREWANLPITLFTYWRYAYLETTSLTCRQCWWRSERALLVELPTVAMQLAQGKVTLTFHTKRADTICRSLNGISQEILKQTRYWFDSHPRRRVLQRHVHLRLISDIPKCDTYQLHTHDFTCALAHTCIVRHPMRRIPKHIARDDLAFPKNE